MIDGALAMAWTCLDAATDDGLRERLTSADTAYGHRDTLPLVLRLIRRPAVEIDKDGPIVVISSPATTLLVRSTSCYTCVGGRDQPARPSKRQRPHHARPDRG